MTLSARFYDEDPAALLREAADFLSTSSGSCRATETDDIAHLLRCVAGLLRIRDERIAQLERLLAQEF